MPLVCILGEVDISYLFCFIFRDLLTFSVPADFRLKVGSCRSYLQVFGIIVVYLLCDYLLLKVILEKKVANPESKNQPEPSR